jgi:hypothetical protein
MVYRAKLRYLARIAAGGTLSHMTRTDQSDGTLSHALAGIRAKARIAAGGTLSHTTRTRRIYRKHYQRHVNTAASPHDAAHVPRTLLCRVMT